MSIIEGILLGLLQGIAEFLPISSSGHLALAHLFFGANEGSTSFDILLHLATLFAVCIAYYKDVLLLIKGFFTLVKKLFTGNIKQQGLDYGEKLFLLVCAATLPLFVAVIIEDRVEALKAYSWAIGLLLILNGLMLFASDRLKRFRGKIVNMKYSSALKVGLMQMIAVLPGVSRSGSTITGGILCGLDRKEAVKFSFLMSIPSILGAAVLKLPGFFAEGMASADVLPVMLGAVTAFAAGICSIKLLQLIAEKNRFGYFSIYCVLVGLIAIIMAFIK